MSITSTNFTQPKTGFVIGISGGGVKVSPSSGMTVAISSGFYFLGGKQSFYAGGTKAISAAHASLTRYDVIGIDSSGTIFVKEGTPAASPSVPIARDDLLLLAVITVTGGDATIASGDITDIRNIGGVSADGTTLSVSSGGVMSVVPSGITGFPAVIASGSGTTNLTGNGAAQTIFTDSFTALSAGEYIEYKVFWDITGISTTANVITNVGTLAVSTVAHGGGGAPNHAFIEGKLIFKPSNQGDVAFTKQYVQGATESAPTITRTMDKVIGGETINGISATVNPAVGQNPTCYYEYLVVKYTMGV